jgi:hypothetical protein
MEFKGKTEELLVKQLKTYERNMQEETYFKRQNLRTMGIEEGKEVQAKGIHNIFNKIITENFPNLEKTIPILVQEASRTPNRLDQNRITPQHSIIKTISTENRERILKAVKEKKQITCKDKPIQNHSRFLSGNLKARKAWRDVLWALNENNFNSRILYSAKLSFKTNGTIKVFYDKQKLKQYMTTKPPPQKIFQGILHTENESIQNHEGTGNTKPQEKKRQESRK